MKNISIAVLSLALIATVYSCSKQTETPKPSSTVTASIKPTHLKRDAAHPHDISIDDANVLATNFRGFMGIPDTDSTKSNILAYDIEDVKEYINMPRHANGKLLLQLGYENDHITATFVCVTPDNQLSLNPRNMLLEHSDQWCPMCKCCANVLMWDGRIVSVPVAYRSMPKNVFNWLTSHKA